MNETMLRDLVTFLMERLEVDPEELVEGFVMDYGYPRADVYRAIAQEEN